MTPKVGETYQFNNAVAVVVELTDSEVTWREEHAKRSFNHRVPRWFFEKCITPIPNGVLGSPSNGLENGK